MYSSKIYNIKISKIQAFQIYLFHTFRPSILTAGKGVAMVVMDRMEYLHKAQHLLEQPTYKPISSDPANKYKVRLINMHRKIGIKWYHGTYAGTMVGT